MKNNDLQVKILLQKMLDWDNIEISIRNLV